jgi:NAD(P)-dependent dehydrogenase (short-subunit alcohol dehydrogenase family)
VREHNDVLRFSRGCAAGLGIEPLLGYALISGEGNVGKLAGRVAIVTGGTSGMGSAIAELFAGESASVVIGGRDPARGAAVVGRIRAGGGEAEFVAGDISSPSASEALVDTAVGRFGGVDILVANAGRLGLGSVTTISIESWRETIATNLDAVFYLLKAGIPRMLERGRGSVVVTGSIAAFKGFPNHAAYCASKGALIAFARQVSADYAPTVRVNVICPGPVDTPLIWDSARAFPDPASAVADAAAATLMKRLGSPADIARAALFLASDDSAWITGAVLTVDGGRTVE